MEPLKIDGLRQGALLLIDSAPIIYTLEEVCSPRMRQAFSHLIEPTRWNDPLLRLAEKVAEGRMRCGGPERSA